ncbi:MAG TPA: sulfate transporter CysZ, partial [Sedimenticola thiotaurini]|nr:sulfate transporter CysZ [Sedimenticola thiotaurini]
DGSIAAEILPALLMELRKLFYFLLRAIPLLILFLIPVVNVAAPFLWFAFSAWFLTIEYMDYPMGNHGLRLRQQFAELRRARLTALGFGSALMLLMMVPVLNFAAMPAAVAGATALWCGRRG